MAQITVKNAAGNDAGTVELDDATFGIQPNVPVMHQVVTAQLAARRAGTQATKTRSTIRGGGRKPYRQKGTGNARQGSTRAPQFSGGAVALGPQPRSYHQKTPKKMVSLALRSALSDRASAGKVVVVESWGWETPSTKAAVKALAGLGVEGRVLVVVGRDDATAALSFRNIPEVQLIAPGELNAYDVLCNDYIVFTSDLLPVFTGASRRSRSASDSAEAQRSAAVPADAAEAAEGSASDEAERREERSDEGAIKQGSASDEAERREERSDEGAIEQGSASDEAERREERSDEGAIEQSAFAPAEWAGAVLAHDGTGPDTHLIKGNADSMLYHLPGSRFYKRTKAEVWFDTEESALAAGFSKPASQQAADDAADDADVAADAAFDAGTAGEGSASDEPERREESASADDEGAAEA